MQNRITTLTLCVTAVFLWQMFHCHTSEVTSQAAIIVIQASILFLLIYIDTVVKSTRIKQLYIVHMHMYINCI